MLSSGLRGLGRLSGFATAGRTNQLRKLLPQHPRSVSGIPASPFIKVTLDEGKGVAELEMVRAPANALTLEFLTAMTKTIKALEEDKNCRGVIFTSNLKGIFSAGLELTELYEPDLDRLRQFWTALQDMWLTLYSTSLITVAAISGHAPAGGCLIGIAADARIFVQGKFRIGLNETEVGIMVPIWLQDNMIQVLGHRKAEYALQHGKLYGPNEALEVGLVEEVVPQLELPAAAKRHMDQFLKIPDQARQLTKASVRKDVIDRFHAKRQEDLDIQMKLIPGAACQGIIGAHLEGIKKKTRRIDT